eukprot:819194_1
MSDRLSPEKIDILPKPPNRQLKTSTAPLLESSSPSMHQSGTSTPPSSAGRDRRSTPNHPLFDGRNSPSKLSNVPVTREEHEVSSEEGDDDSNSDFAGTESTSEFDLLQHRNTNHEKANLEMAVLHRNETMINQGPRNNFEKFPLSMPDIRFTEFGGVGTYLYFRILRLLGGVFLLLAIFALPQMICCILAGNIPSTPLRIEQTTLGNLASHNAGMDALHNLRKILPAFLFPEDELSSTKTLGFLFSSFDVIAIAIFIVFIKKLRFGLKREARVADNATVSVSDYAVRVRNLPTDLTDRKELAEFFKQFGPVVDVALEYNDSVVISSLNKRGEIRNKIAAARQKGKNKRASKLQAVHRKLNTRVGMEIACLSRHCVEAYVTFQYGSSRAECIRSLKVPWYLALFMKKELRFRGEHRLAVRNATEPSNIVFQNLHLSETERFFRRFANSVASFLLILASVVVIMKAVNYQFALSQNNKSGRRCSGDSVSLSELKSMDQSPSNEFRILCACQQIGLLAISRNPELRDGICREYSLKRLKTAFIDIGLALGITTMNLVIQQVIARIHKFARHRSVSDSQASMMTNLFYITFANTGLCVLIANADTTSVLGFTIIEGKFNDFLPEWYRIVGQSIMLTMFVNIFNPHILPLILMPFHWLQRKLSSKNVTQLELDNIFEGGQFTLAYRCAVLANTIFVTLMYSPGLPLLLWFATATYMLIYWSDKVALLRYYRTPPSFDESLAEHLIDLIYKSVYLHLVFAVWMYGSPGVLESYSMSKSLNSDLIPADIPKFGRRIFNWNACPSAVLLVVLLGLDLLEKFGNVVSWSFVKAFISKKIYVYNENSYFEEQSSGIRFATYHLNDQKMNQNAFVEPCHEMYPRVKPLYEDPEYEVGTVFDVASDGEPDLSMPSVSDSVVKTV